MTVFKIPLFAFIIILSFIIIGISLVLFLAYLNTTVDSIPEEGASFIIELGEPSESIFRRLEKEKLIKSSLLIKLIAKLYGSEDKIKAGIYRIKAGLTTFDIHQLLVSGRQELKRLTIKEGWTLKQIAQELERQNICKASDFIHLSKDTSILKKYQLSSPSVEGFLFPDTYYFTEKTQTSMVIDHLIQTFFKKLAEIEPDYQKLSAKELLTKIIIASIVEREYREEKEAPVIASVFYNRLKKGMRLESCATVAYIITDILGRPHPDALSYQDLKIKSPYNTYEVNGLPPGAICNPGKTALIAAFFPMKSEYLYFVLKDPQKGTHEFSQTYTQHVQAIKFFLKK